MKKQLLTSLMALCAGAVLADTTTSYTFVANQAVPDANPTGLALHTNLMVGGGMITDVKVTLNLSGGYNGDLYAYLAGPNGGFSVLFDRVGASNNASAFGYSDAGFNITLSDAASDIHYYQNGIYTLSGGRLTGTWQPDGRNIDPLTNNPAAFLDAPQTAMLNSFIGTDPNGIWTLFLADMSGGSSSQLLDWGVQITVPEPSPFALSTCGVALFALIRKLKSARVS